MLSGHWFALVLPPPPCSVVAARQLCCHSYKPIHPLSLPPPFCAVPHFLLLPIPLLLPQAEKSLEHTVVIVLQKCKSKNKLICEKDCAYLSTLDTLFRHCRRLAIFCFERPPGETKIFFTAFLKCHTCAHMMLEIRVSRKRNV